ncbi:MAG: group 1 truncated hemoglobin [Paenibacillaceae bacterium]|nr:group 1 truncated hemoglobin [Paenibacillaceae bacterium]
MEGLFERLGREKLLFRVVDEFYTLLLQDERVNGYFAGIDMVRLRQHQLSFLSSILGGPEQYTGRSMRNAHRALHLTEAHFDAVAEHLQTALRRCNVSPADIEAVMEKITSYKEQIISS